MERIGSLVVTASTRTWVPDRNSWKDLVGKWPCYCTSTSQDDATRDEANRSSSCGAIASNWPNGNARKMSKWPSRWISTDQDQSIELPMTLIASAVVELLCLQVVTDGGTKGQMVWGTGGDYFIVALTFLLKGGGQTCMLYIFTAIRMLYIYLSKLKFWKLEFPDSTFILWIKPDT